MLDNKQSYYLVVGLGSSGLSMARFLHGKGKKVVATDINQSNPETTKALKTLGIESQIGFHDQKTFNLAHAIVVSPGIPLDMIYLKTAVEKGVPLLGELDIFSQFNKTPIIAITGTNGKTTTTTLIRDMLNASGITTFTGGNIGTPLVEYLMEDKTCDMIVGEISSFQLDLAHNFRPQIALLLNIAEDHLDRYQGFEGYTDSKWGIFKNQTSQDKAIVNKAVDGFETRISKISSRVFSFSAIPANIRTNQGAGAIVDGDMIHLKIDEDSHTIDTRDLTQLVGVHNRENIAAAAIAAFLAGGDIQGIRKALKDFKNLPHRIGFVKKIKGVSFYNDSKATNTDAVIRALESFKERVILILGGREKGTDFSLLTPQVKKRVKQIIALGEAGQHIQDTLGNICPVLQVNAMEEAVRKAQKIALPGEVVLLSPACASFDMYENYGARGDDFIAQTNKLAAMMSGGGKNGQ